MIDSDRITKELSEYPLIGDENGLIATFGVYLTRMFADYYSEISYEFEKEFSIGIPEEVQEAARLLLIEAGHVCGFNTFGGIMKSDEWKAIVLPMINKHEDWIVGMIACINALGWGRYTINNLVPDKELVLDIANSYESTYHLKTYGNTAKTGKCYLAVGASVALMNLLYNGDITEYPELDEDFYNHLFLNSSKFIGEEVLCRSKGDNICQIRVSLS